MLELKNRKQILSASQGKLGLTIKARILLASIVSDYMKVWELMLSKAIFPAFQVLGEHSSPTAAVEQDSPPASPAPSNQTLCLEKLKKSTFCPSCLFLSKHCCLCCSRQGIFTTISLNCKAGGEPC